MSSENSTGSVHALPITTRPAAADNEPGPSPKQQMLQELAHLTAAVEANLITGLDILSGTDLDGPTRHRTLGSFAHDPLDTLLLSLSNLQRQATELKDQQLARREAQLAAMLQSNGF